MELESRRRAEARLRNRQVELEEERVMADAPGLLDPVSSAVILDVPGGHGRWLALHRPRASVGPNGGRSLRTEDVRAWVVEERQVQAQRKDRRSGESTATAL